MKKLLLLVMMYLPMMAMADAVEIDGIYYNLISKAGIAEVTSNPNKYSGSITIPHSVTYEEVEYDVTSIGQSAFYCCKDLNSVIIPNSVTSIGGYAFWGTSINSLDIPNSVNKIGRESFRFISTLASLKIPDSVTDIGDATFWDCTGLSSITLSKNLSIIGERMFQDCALLTTITVPEGVSKISNSAFEGCSGLTSINIPNSVTSIGSRAFVGCSSLTSITIPISVTGIGKNAFQNCSGLSSITIPTSIYSIDEYVFQNCNSLITLNIPNSVTKIAAYAFNGCKSLNSITIPNSVTIIGNNAFSDCSGLISINIGSGVTSISSLAFASCQNLADVTCFAETVPNTSSNAFENSYIEYATLHVPAASIDSYKANEPWSNFKSIVSLEGVEVPKCATPTIKYIGGKLLFECVTEGVEFVYSITTPANTIDQTGNNVDMPHTNIVCVYAKKEGYQNSDVATENIDVRGIQGDTNRDGVVTVADAVGVVNIILEKNE